MRTKRQPEQIGAELVEASRNPDEVALPLSTRMFPYIYVASRRMSLRTISAWLQDKHNLSLSAAAISRALANPALHLQRLAESIAGPARYVATAYGYDPMSLLFDTVAENGPVELDILVHDHPQPDSEDDIHRWSELHDLHAVWGPIPHEVCLLLKPYLQSEFGDPDGVPPRDEDDF